MLRTIRSFTCSSSQSVAPSSDASGTVGSVPGFAYRSFAKIPFASGRLVPGARHFGSSTYTLPKLPNDTVCVSTRGGSAASASTIAGLKLCAVCSMYGSFVVSSSSSDDKSLSSGNSSSSSSLSSSFSSSSTSSGSSPSDAPASEFETNASISLSSICAWSSSACSSISSSSSSSSASESTAESLSSSLSITSPICSLNSAAKSSNVPFVDRPSLSDSSVSVDAYPTALVDAFASWRYFLSASICRFWAWIVSWPHKSGVLRRAVYNQVPNLLLLLLLLLIVAATHQTTCPFALSVVSCISILVVGSLIGEAVLLPRVPAYDLRIFGSGWAAVTTIPPVRNLLPVLTPGDGTVGGPIPLPAPFTPFGGALPLLGPADSGAVVDGTLSSALRGEPAVERELVASRRRD
uniref:Uncharacterized protein n=1 Tax=Anopheles maculatus TaxID=74869 RepID=A0A182SRI1_9DIPT